MEKILLLTMAWSSLCFAGSISDLRETVDLDEVNYHNGYYDIQKYDPKKFDAVERIRTLKAEKHKNSICKWTIKGGRRNAISTIAHYDEKLTRAIQKLYDQNKIHKAIVEQADNSKIPESCSIERIEIYSKDGEVLYLNFDFTT